MGLESWKTSFGNKPSASSTNVNREIEGKCCLINEGIYEVKGRFNAPGILLSFFLMQKRTK